MKRLLRPERDFVLSIVAAAVSTVVALVLGGWLVAGRYHPYAVIFVEWGFAVVVYVLLSAGVSVARRNSAAGER